MRALYEARAAQLLGLLEVEITEVLRGRGRDAGEAPALALALLAMIEGLFHLSQAAPSVIRAGEGLDLALAWARARLEGAP